MKDLIEGASAILIIGLVFAVISKIEVAFKNRKGRKVDQKTSISMSDEKALVAVDKSEHKAVRRVSLIVFTSIVVFYVALAFLF